MNIQDANLESSWYKILGTTSNITFTGNYGRIDQSLWEEIWDNTEENGTIIIRFTAIDGLGNTNYKDLILIKPITQPETENNDNHPIFPIKLIEFIPISIIIGFSIALSAIIKKSRFYNVTDKRHQKLINRIMILVALLSSLIAISFLIQ